MYGRDIDLAEKNLTALRKNIYPGRGLIAGIDRLGKNLVQVYWIMGRSQNSRNRVFVADSDKGRVSTEAADPAKVEDPGLIIYNAMMERKEHGWIYIVSNGKQTNTAINLTENEASLQRALSGWIYEPDAPNFTPRITAACRIIPGAYFIELSLLRKSDWNAACDRFYYRYEHVENGLGFCLTTYLGDGNPLPAFSGEPLLMPLYSDINEVLDTYWLSLNEANRVSLAVKFISVSTGRSVIKIANKYSKVA